MDLLRHAYAAASDDEEEDEKKPLAPPPKRTRSGVGGLYYPPPPPPVLLGWDHHHLYGPTANTVTTSAAVPGVAPPAAAGRYVSKRERAAILAASTTTSSLGIPDPSPLPPPTVITSSVVGSISKSGLPHDILAALRACGKGRLKHSRSFGGRPVVLNGHTKAINALQWSQSHAHLLASAGMDQTVCVWNVWSGEGWQKARVFTYHKSAVKDVKWSSQGLSLLSCGYDCSSRLVDVEKGIETQLFQEDQVVGVIKFHPCDPHLFLSGGLKGSLRLWDIRVGKVVQEYVRSLGPILDVDFSPDARNFISSSDISQSSASENSIVVWDVSRQIPLSNQVYVEAYTCPCIKYHPYDPSFVAQSNGNYIAIFSARPPFKLDKYKRYEKHGVLGFPIRCSFSLDGSELASGSSDGSIYFYNCKSSELLSKIKAFEDACIDVVFHPLLPNVIAACSWNGEVSVFE